LTGNDENGIVLPVKIVQGWEEDFEEVFLGLSTDGGKICVENPGIYWIAASTTDAKGGCGEVLVKLFVNER